MHYILFDSKSRKTVYFSTKPELLDWILSHSYVLTLRMLHRILIYRCPSGFSEYLSIYRSLPKDYYYCTLNQFIMPERGSVPAMNFIHLHEEFFKKSDHTVLEHSCPCP